jgi:HAD superfamily hydrolase (TIGR01509 family)
MIKAIAFDFVGVFVKENDFILDSTERLLESKFGLLNTDEEFFQWAENETKLPEEELRQKVKHIIQNIYDLREPDIFTKLPNIKFSTATNHLSYLDGWFKTLPISNYFQYLVNSAVIGAQKPEKKFYEILANTLKEEPKNILFIDDNAENCLRAGEFGLKVIHFQREETLSDVILERLKPKLKR